MWIPIYNQMIQEEMPKIKPIGLQLYSLLLIEASGKNYCRLSIRDIMTTLNIKSKVTAKKRINDLIQHSFISTLDDLKTARLNSCLKFNLLYEHRNGFEQMPVKNFYLNLNSNEWAVLCVLAVFHNKKWGYSQLTIEQIMGYLNIHRRNTITNAVKKLEELELIKVHRTKPFVAENTIVPIANKYLINYK